MVKKVINKKAHMKPMELKIVEKLQEIQEDLDFIKKHMVDVDMVLTVEDKKILDKSISNEKAGKLISLEAIKNARNKAR